MINTIMEMTAIKGLARKAALGLAVGMLLLAPVAAEAHCDTMDGPTVKDALKAMETDNVNYALKWVQPRYEGEVIRAFNLSMKVKDINADTRNLAEQYFFEILLRDHRAGEGAPFEGVKPHGTPIDERVKAADRSIEEGNLKPLEHLVDRDKQAELERRFQRVMAIRDFDVNNLEAGREYIEAYVQFFKFAEGEEDEHHGVHGHGGHEALHGQESVSYTHLTLPTTPYV